MHKVQVFVCQLETLKGSKSTTWQPRWARALCASGKAVHMGQLPGALCSWIWHEGHTTNVSRWRAGMKKKILDWDYIIFLHLSYDLEGIRILLKLLYGQVQYPNFTTCHFLVKLSQHPMWHWDGIENYDKLHTREHVCLLLPPVKISENEIQKMPFPLKSWLCNAIKIWLSQQS